VYLLNLEEAIKCRMSSVESEAGKERKKKQRKTGSTVISAVSWKSMN